MDATSGTLAELLSFMSRRGMCLILALNHELERLYGASCARGLDRAEGAIEL